MKVVLVNGSPHKEGCTFEALKHVALALEEQQIETEIFHLGVKPVSGCLGCGKCAETGYCFIDDVVNTFIDKAKESDGFIFGTPVHFAAASGSITSFMDRAFYGRSGIYAFKPAATVVSCRRGGASAAFDQMNKYYTISSMPVVSSNYWNMVHGTSPEHVAQDEEGVQTMQILGKNMAWLLKCIEAGKSVGIDLPKTEPRIKTNFIR